MSPSPEIESNEKLAKSSVSHPAYDKIEECLIAEYGLNCTLFKHRKSGAQVSAIDRIFYT